ncbi:MAG: flagellar export protein FliJ [Bdellovibrionaceae bacterium]|nr:flagellar export protein FliJ [Pseudobdellovibrionaceae bacterium]
MKFNFRMQKVLEHRKVQENLAKTDFQVAQSRLNEEVEKLQNMIDQKKKARVKSFELETGVDVPNSLRNGILEESSRFQKLQDVRIGKQREIIAEWEKEVESKREVLKTKAIEYKILEKVKDKKKQQFIDEANKKEQNENDEISILRFASRNKK